MNWMLRGAIAKWDPTNKKMSVFRVPTLGATPYGAAIDANDNVWAADWIGGKLGKFDTTVNQWTEFTPPMQPASFCREPSVDAMNNVRVGILAGGPRPGKLAKLDQTGGRWTEWDPPHRRRPAVLIKRGFRGQYLVSGIWRAGPSLRHRPIQSPNGQVHYSSETSVHRRFFASRAYRRRRCLVCAALWRARGQ